MSLAVVTGAASGVGAAVAALLAEQGVPTIGVDVNDGPGSWVRGDVADPETWRRVVEVADGRTVDRLVLAAAVLEVGTALQVTADALRRVMDVNVVGALLGVQACLPGMLAAGGGRIVAVASVDAFLAEQGLAAYCASKGALLQLLRCVAV
ncbi:MAG: SDR family oxidoreductase, partial [Dactylosporangium sp.]|nr:SDR family oxidoreductase [Dactylosporangium sp.]